MAYANVRGMWQKCVDLFRGILTAASAVRVATKFNIKIKLYIIIKKVYFSDRPGVRSMLLFCSLITARHAMHRHYHVLKVFFETFAKLN